MRYTMAVQLLRAECSGVQFLSLPVFICRMGILLAWLGPWGYFRHWEMPVWYLEWRTVFIFYCCTTNYRARSSSKLYPFIISQFLQVRAWLRWPLYLSVTRLQSRCHLDCAPSWRLKRGRNLFHAHSHSWQNSFPCCSKTKYPSFFRAVGWRPPTAPRRVGFSSTAALLHQTGKVRL